MSAGGRKPGNQGEGVVTIKAMFSPLNSQDTEDTEEGLDLGESVVAIKAMFYTTEPQFTEEDLNLG